ncbi:glycoside hydrolase family 88 protein [Sphingobacterium lumbrici]|uniref:glycoside hydrolase family 88 protein n=1 Tax=Sphingobacterium lumbrici TaxID=2559600 RepID=UPI001F3DDD4D|nr:glycoside hydrolase family 88 protein [Sphingobacterium lumbrici]
MSLKNVLVGMGCALLLMAGCKSNAQLPTGFIPENINNAVAQYTLQTNTIEASGKVLNPGYINNKGDVVYVTYEDWRSGFYPGSVWYLYALTGDEKWRLLAEKYTEALEEVQHLTWHHDVGFMVGSSYLNGLRFAQKEAYKDVIVQAAKSLSTRFRPAAGIIQSWNTDGGWQAKRGWKCPVIIDNMMNLELLFEATQLSGDSSFYDIAVSHADKTLANHFRADASSFHVVDYDPETGEVRSHQTAQGYAHESAWARGQAWALFGYTMCYRYTHNPLYLEQAKKIYDFIFSHNNLPGDLVPYWDFDALNIPNEPRDASTAAIIASALYEMSTHEKESKYKETADEIMKSLSSPAYRAQVGSNGNFILMHSVGSIPHQSEIDVPLNYADYYYLEALVRKRDLEK